MPGIDMNQRDQEEYYISLIKQYEKENELLSSYKQMCKFDIDKLDQPIPEDFKARRPKAATTDDATTTTTTTPVAKEIETASNQPQNGESAKNDVMEYDLNRSDSIVELKD